MTSKTEVRDGLPRLLVAAVAAIALGNGLFMLFAPFAWYEWIGTVKASGPPNGHFIRDIGLAYLVCASALGYAAASLARRLWAAVLGVAWLTLHGGLHIWEVMGGICSPGIFWRDAPATLGPPLIALAGIGLHLYRVRSAPVSTD